MQIRSITVPGLLLFCAFAQADALSDLKAFIASSKTVSAHFEQVVQGTNSKKIQKSNGEFSLQRPGKFRWEYSAPLVQLIIGDGNTIWVYDPELQQVIQRKQNNALGNTPAALLAGSNDLESRYQIKNLPDRGGLVWLEAVPREKESTFKSIKMGFNSGLPASMELTDNFGQLTRISFSGLKINPTLDNKIFRFAPPKGADIIKDEQ